MKTRLILGLFIVFAVLPFSYERVQAAERVVMNSLPSESWYENVYLLADKISWNDYRNFDLQIGNEGVLHHFSDWRSGKYGTKMYSEDLNGDRQKEIIIVLDNDKKPIHIMQYGGVGSNQDYKEVLVETVGDAVKRLVKMEKEDDIVTITTKQKTYKVNLKSIGYSNTASDTKLYTHENVEYFIEKNKLIADAGVMISIGGGSAIGNFILIYGWDRSRYEVQSITFERYVPSN